MEELIILAGNDEGEITEMIKEIFHTERLIFKDEYPDDVARMSEEMDGEGVWEKVEKEKKKLRRFWRVKYCSIHMDSFGEKVRAVCFWHTRDGTQYFACKVCGEIYEQKKKRIVEWFGVS